MKIEFPVLNVKMISVSKIIANDYNPNRVASVEMRLLQTSIENDGYTQPVVLFYDSLEDIYILVDGYHRYKLAKEIFKIPEIPGVVINKPLNERMGSTVRHNRARGTHQICGMSDIVLNLTKNGWTDEKIAKELGMDFEEILRLKQITGLKEAFANHEFSKSWAAYKEKRSST
jgi:ParB-like chromosome segregation protein Spo0J